MTNNPFKKYQKYLLYQKKKLYLQKKKRKTKMKRKKFFQKSGNKIKQPKDTINK